MNIYFENPVTLYLIGCEDTSVLLGGLRHRWCDRGERCEDRQCVPRSCSLLHGTVANGRISPDGSSAVGSAGTLSCDPGFSIGGRDKSAEVVCTGYGQENGDETKVNRYLW